MQAIEINTLVKNGMLKIPFHGNGNSVKVIIMWDNKDENNYDFKGLMLLINELKKIKAFDKISNPVKWQKEIRNEWE